MPTSIRARRNVLLGWGESSVLSERGEWNPPKRLFLSDPSELGPVFVVRLGMMANRRETVRLPWREIETVLLDMDGTLLDLYFDDYFWMEHVPRRYGEIHGLSLEEARSLLLERYRRYQGKLEWYSVDFWSCELGLDIAKLKEEVKHLVAEQPHGRDFLSALRTLGKRTVLVTNAHGKSLRLKMRETNLERELDAVVCAHDLGVPKEEPYFWSRLQEVEPFVPERTLLIDDSVPVLHSAKDFGLRYLLCVARPNRRAPAQEVKEFPVLEGFDELLLDLSSAVTGEKGEKGGVSAAP